MNKRLPARAYASAMALLEAEQQALALSTSTSQKVSEAQRALSLNPNGPNANDIRLEIERLEASRLKYQDQYRVRANLRAQVEHFLSRIPADAALCDAKSVKPKLKDGEALIDGLQRVRKQIGDLGSERRDVESAGLPVAEMKARAKKFVAERAATIQPTIIATHDRFDVNFLNPTAFTSRIDPINALCWFDPERMKARLFEQIEAMPKPKLALSPSEKADRLREIAETLFALERQEEAIIVAAEDVGMTLARRHNASPAAILGLIVDHGAKEKAA